MLKNGAWSGNEYREYDENGRVTLEVSEDGYGIKFTRTDADGNKEELSEAERIHLVNRLKTLNIGIIGEDKLSEYINKMSV